MKLTKKAKASLLILLTGGTMTTMSATIEDQSAFEKAINDVKIEYEYEGIYELSQSYSDWKDYKGVDYSCSENHTSVLDQDVSNITDMILENSKPFLKALPEYKELGEEYLDAFEYSLKEVITDMKERCDHEELEAFSHSLSSLAIVETKEDSDALMSYNTAYNMITVYDSVIRSQIMGEEMYFQTLAQNSFLHELSHMEQNPCPCHSLECQPGFGNYVIQEAFASTNYESEFSSYPLEEDLYRLFVNSYLFSNSKGTIAIQDAILHNDLKKMIHLFEGKSKELYDVMNTMEFLSFKQNDDLNRYYKKLHGKNIDATDRANIRREMYGDFSSSLLKNYTIHLLNYVKNKDIPLDDILFFYKWYLGQLESFYQSYYVTYQDNIDIHSSDYLIYLEKITKQLFQTLAEEYQVTESDIYKRFSSLSSEEDTDLKIKAYVPYHLLDIMNDDVKEQLQMGNYHFVYADEVMNITTNKVYKKEK